MSQTNYVGEYEPEDALPEPADIAEAAHIVHAQADDDQDESGLPEG